MQTAPIASLNQMVGRRLVPCALKLMLVLMLVILIAFFAVVRPFVVTRKHATLLLLVQVAQRLTSNGIRLLASLGPMQASGAAV